MKENTNLSFSKKFLQFLLNKYIIIIIIFVVWMLFFDTNSVLVHHKLNKEITHLDNKITHFEKKITADSILYKSLKNNKEQKEKYARENYFMKKQNEDIFIIVHKKDSMQFQ